MSYNAQGVWVQPKPWSRFNLPGLNLPLNWSPGKVEGVDGEGRPLFKTALNDADLSDGYVSLPLTTLREFAMLEIMDWLTDKPNWFEKVFNDEIAQKWKVEAMATEGRDVSQKMVDWIIEELRYKAGIFKETGTISVYNGDVVKSDVAVPESLKLQLREQVLKLENIPEKYKDWHPGSNGQVLDIVHPSLFPLVYGQSRVVEDELIELKDCIESSGKGKVVPSPKDEELSGPQVRQYIFRNFRPGESPNPYSRNFQWLPCEVDISNEDGSAKITSYINNLHPHRYRELYEIIESIIAKAIPLWDKTLTPLREHDTFQRISYTETVFDPDPDDMPEDEKPQQEDGETEDQFWDRRNDWEEDTRKVVQPEPGAFRAPEDVQAERKRPGKYYDLDLSKYMPKPSVDIRRDYSKRGLQVIVKLANIQLTPENPQYGGGSWHVEGQLNEHICATALYYYDTENITDSHLAFRQQSSWDDASEISYPQSVHGWLTEVFGCEQDGPAMQDVGAILCREGRLITFPNILQHQVQPFKLLDPTKPGHRKILALFLVDPGIRIISTANVPPQQKDWWSERINNQMARSGKALGKLSNELKDKIVDDVDDFPISMEKAKELRLELMAERSVFVSAHEGVFQEQTFNLCEH
ncbi:uncharacterized protein PAC_01700 [Phialocephala subalpina]|uniref:Uncharacterized protein n=1 Tax=Phialocephala subalpina TaxID=576137 RepID=A0A1L7WGD2_9HELO|nr:uncharacterized protein PAC_01700 [Phialocephala subalpina]